MIGIALALALAQADVQEPTGEATPEAVPVEEPGQARTDVSKQEVDELRARVNALEERLEQSQAALDEANEATQAANAELDRRAQAARAQDEARAERAESLLQVHVALGELRDALEAGSSDISGAQASAIARFQAVSDSAHASGSEREAFFADDAVQTLQQISESLDRQAYLDAQLLLARAMWDANQGIQAALSSPPASAPFQSGPSQ